DRRGAHGALQGQDADDLRPARLLRAVPQGVLRGLGPVLHRGGAERARAPLPRGDLDPHPLVPQRPRALAALDLGGVARLPGLPRRRVDEGALPELPPEDRGLRRLPVPGVRPHRRPGQPRPGVHPHAAPADRGRGAGRGVGGVRVPDPRGRAPARVSAPLAIETEGLGRDYGTVRALDALDLRIPAGALVGLLGPNGAGKTTAMLLLATLLHPSRGRARVFGHDVTRERAAVRRRLGLVFQEPSVDGLLTVEENLLFAARLAGLDGRAG